jgi:hypothetical protein
MEKEIYFYHIVFDFKSKVGHGIGSMSLDLPAKIKSAKDVKNLKEFIERKNTYDNVIIIKWIELEE